MTETRSFTIKLHLFRASLQITASLSPLLSLRNSSYHHTLRALQDSNIKVVSDIPTSDRQYSHVLNPAVSSSAAQVNKLPSSHAVSNNTTSSSSFSFLSMVSSMMECPFTYIQVQHKGSFPSSFPLASLFTYRNDLVPILEHSRFVCRPIPVH